VLSGGQWLDSLHGTSALSLFRSLTLHSYRVEILSNSHTPRRLGNDSFSILALESKKNVPLLTRISLFRRFFEHLVACMQDLVGMVTFDIRNHKKNTWMLPLWIWKNLLRMWRHRTRQKGICKSNYQRSVFRYLLCSVIYCFFWFNCF